MGPSGQLSSQTAAAEQALFRGWRDRHDISMARQLASSHRHLVVKLAEAYGDHGFPAEDLIAEGHVGMMRAICRFDPDCGARFAPYATRWIQAAIQEYMLRGQLRDHEDGMFTTKH